MRFAGWGWGVVALLAELLRREVPVVVVSSVPRWFFEESLKGLDYISTQVTAHVSCVGEFAPRRFCLTTIA
jgi:beta-phosphoglucomutase-like phosphatase (HAD superfamily)